MKKSIAAVIITYNEERNIHRCLESLGGVADEIVVVDSYSTDRTQEICRSFNAKFIKHRFIGHIEQKNWAILQTNSPYILSLDADEVLSDELRASILRAKENWTHDGYYFNRLTNYCGKWIRHTSWYPSRKLRMWDARKGNWGGFNPHDRYYLKKGASRMFLKGDILHYSYYSVSEHLMQINTFSTILAHSYYERGKRAYFFSLILHPFWRFIKDYFIYAGFLDGYYGFIVSVNSAHEVFMKYVKLTNIYKAEKQKQKTAICFFNSLKTWGGGEKWHFDMANFVQSKGHRVILVTSHDSSLSARMKESGVQSYKFRLSNLSFSNPLKLFRVVRILRRENVGTLVTSLSGDMKIASIAAKIAGVPNIIYRRGIAIPIRNVPINRYLLRRVVTKIIANSEETKRTILLNNPRMVPEGKIVIIYNGVYLERYNRDVKPQFRGPSGEIILGCAGRLSVEKGHVHLLELMRELSASSLSFRLLIAGEGRLLFKLKRKARELSVDHLVDFVGFVEDMPEFLSSLDIFLLPSRYEGFSNVICEAMASSLPLVVFDVKSSAEVIVDGISGYIIPNGDVREMAKKVIHLAGDKALRTEMGLQSRKLVEETFSMDQIQNDILQLLQSKS